VDVIPPKEYSPFTPGQPAPVEFFVGRLPEIERLKGLVAHAATGRLKVVFVAGERGIGKSSLASFVRYLSERDHHVLGIHTYLGGASRVEDLVSRVFDRMVKDSEGRGFLEKIKNHLGPRVQKVGLFGVSLEFKASDQELGSLGRNFSRELSSVLAKLENGTKGLLLILDDINGLAGSEPFAHWLKSLVDEIATSGRPFPVCLLLVGLEERRQSLIALQPSLARIFDVVDIAPWSSKESGDFFESSFQKVGTKVDPAALNVLTTFSGGLPVLAHEIGDAVFKRDVDRNIDESEAILGVNDAADVVGRKFLQPQIMDEIRSQRYRAILRKMAKGPFEPGFRRSDLQERLEDAERRVLDNFLRRMKELGVVRMNPEGGRGAYHFTTVLHYLFFRMEARRAESRAE